MKIERENGERGGEGGNGGEGRMVNRECDASRQNRAGKERETENKRR